MERIKKLEKGGKNQVLRGRLDRGKYGKD